VTGDKQEEKTAMCVELKAICLYLAPGAQYSALSFFCSSLVAYHLSLPLKISAGQLFEIMLPASFALTVILSTWVLASARRYRFRAATVTLWTLGTLFFPFIILPLYLIARSFRRRLEPERAEDEAESDSENRAEAENAQPPLRSTLPLAYLVLMLSLGALYFYMDWRSVDSHLARANQARVQGQSARVIEEYRAALKLEDDAHTHNLLAKEFMAANRYDEALAEFRIAERMGEEDEELTFNLAATLDKLDRTAEAKPEYERFLTGAICVEVPQDERCAAVRKRVIELARGKPH
jgi:tetratricopeptide (TPR) repeat protein